MKNLSDDRKALADAEEMKFKDACMSEFVQGTLAAENAEKVRKLMLASFLPNLLSLVTASFFIYHLLSVYSTVVLAVLGLLLLTVAFVIEGAKRGLSSALGKRWQLEGKAAPLAVIALAVCMAISMGASYMGGNALVVEASPVPDKVEDEQLATLRAQYDAESDNIAALKATTWKGKITRDASKGIIAAKATQNALLERIQTLEAADDATHTETVTTHKAKITNFGYVLGGLAALADIALLLMIWTAKRLKYEVAAAALTLTHRSVNGNSGVNGTHSSVNGNTVNGTHSNVNGTQPPPTQPQRIAASASAKRPIGFTKTNANANAKTRACAHCGSVFEYKNRRAKYCSDDCRGKAWEQRNNAKLPNYKTDSSNDK